MYQTIPALTLMIIETKHWRMGMYVTTLRLAKLGRPRSAHPPKAN